MSETLPDLYGERGNNETLTQSSAREFAFSQILSSWLELPDINIL